MSDEIAIGVVVRLKSGGPKMTVVQIAKTQFATELSVWCEWFDEKNKAQKGTFSLVAVELASLQDEPPAPPRKRAVRIIKH